MFSAVATSSATFATGYGDGFLVAAAVSVLWAGVSLAALPARRLAVAAPLPAH
jgi:hypothetical protein